MQCPKCDGTMQRVAVAGVEVDRCEACEGLWFDLREHEHSKQAPGSEAIDTGDEATGQQQDAIRDLRCPHCHAQMVSQVFPQQPHIHYEQCSICGGLYLDAGEFRDFKELTLAERVKWMFNL